MKIKFTFPGEPKAIQSFRFAKIGNFVRKYQPKQNSDWKGYIRQSAIAELPENWNLIDTPIRINKIIFAFTPVASLSKSEKKAIENGDYVLKDTKPDLSDNLAKGLMDALESIVYTNDSRIAWNKEVIKVYHKNPRIEIEFEAIENRIIPKEVFES